MGIVIKHSAWNLGITAIGFVLGAANTLLLATKYLSDDYYGLWGYVLSSAFLLFPLMSFGIHNTVVKFYSSYKSKAQKDAFLTQMLVLPLLIILPVVTVIYFFEFKIIELITRVNTMVGAYVWHIILIGIFHAYFEIFYAWVKVQMKTIGGNLIKEVFYRFSATLLLILVWQEMISQKQFIDALVLVYILRCCFMMILAFKTYLPRFRIDSASFNKQIFTYSFLMLIAGSVGTLLIDLDKYMINQYLEIETISYYGVAVYIATVIAIPARGMSQITHPLTAGYLNSGALDKMEDLYKRSSLNLSIVSGFLMVVILCNVQEFYKLLPPEFAVAIPIVFIISLVKFAENLSGSNNAILYNSNLYKVTLWLGLGLAVLAIVLNLILIPKYGLIGAGISTCVAFICYAGAKIAYVHLKLKVHPWTPQTWKSIAVIVVTITIFVFWDFNYNVIVNIALKTLMLSVFYLFAVYKLELSKEINTILKKYTGL